MATDPQTPIFQIPLLGTVEKDLLLKGWNNTERPLPDISSINEYLEKHAQDTPQQKAVVYQDQSLTYAQLHKQSSLLAMELLSKGVQSNTIIGLYCQRSVDMMVGIFRHPEGWSSLFTLRS